MRRTTKTQAAINLPTLTLEGGLFLPGQLEKAAFGHAQWQGEADYNTPKGLKLKDEYSRAFQIATALWKHFAAQLERTDVDAITLTQTFVQELLRDVFGYTGLHVTQGVILGERHYPVSLLFGHVPVVVAPHSLALHDSDPRFAITGSGTRKKSAFMATQELLNASPDHVWGIACNGKQLRLLRDAATLTRPSFVEVDLADLLGGQRYAEFASVWRLLHASRATGEARSCIWERWRTAGQEVGTRVREGLRQGVTNALLTLGEGFLQHPANDALRTALHCGELSSDAYFQQLLRLIYRLIFVFSVEERGLLHPKDDSKASQTARRAYAEGYALARIRALSSNAGHAMRLMTTGRRCASYSRGWAKESRVWHCPPWAACLPPVNARGWTRPVWTTLNCSTPCKTCAGRDTTAVWCQWITATWGQKSSAAFTKACLNWYRRSTFRHAASASSDSPAKAVRLAMRANSPAVITPPMRWCKSSSDPRWTR